MRPEHAVVISCNQGRLEGFLSQWYALDDPKPSLEIYAVERDEEPIRGCWQSHLSVLNGAATDQLAVFEDDAVFGPDFTWEVDVHPEWDLVYLGGQCPDRDWSNDAVPLVRFCHQTHAYVAHHPRELARLVGAQPEPYAHVDCQLGHLLPLRKFAVNPPTVGQRGHTTSDISGEYRPNDQFYENPRRDRS